MMLLHQQLLVILIIIFDVLLVGLTIIHAAPSSSSSSSSSSTRGRNNNNNNNNNNNVHSSSYRRCFDFSQSILFDEATTTTKTNNNKHNKNTTATPSQLFELLTQSTKCERCPLQNNNNNNNNNNRRSSSLRQTTKDNNKDNKNIINKVEIDESGLLKTYHVVIFLTDDRIEYISLAASLLEHNFTVTILHLQNFVNLESRILSRLTCEQESFVRRKERLFLLEAYNNNNNNNDDIRQQPNNNDTTATGNYSSSSSKSSSSSLSSSYSSYSVSSCRVTSTEPYDACTIKTAGKNIQQIYSLFTKLSAANQPIPFPDVLIMDITFVGGLLLSEVSFVPTVAIASPHALKLAIEHDPNWTPNLLNKEWSWFYRLYRILCQRIHSLSLTLPFMALNAIRGRLGLYLRLLKTPIEYLNPVVALILEDVPSESIPLHQVMTTSTSSSSTTDHQWSQRAFVTGSLQPPCVPCLPPSSNDNNNNEQQQQPSYRTAFKKNKPPTTTSAASSASSKTDLPPKILIWPSPEITPASARSLIRGTILARDSLESYDECEWDSLSCRNVVSNFGILWLEQQEQVQVVVDNEINDDDDNNNIPSSYLFPEVVPSYVSKEKSVSLVDSLARHPQTIAVLAHCDSTSMVIPLFGISLLCISHSERGDFGSTMQQRLPLDRGAGEIDPSEVAIRLLQILRERNNIAAAAALDDEDEENPDDGEESVAESSSSSPPPSTTTTNPATNANAVDSFNGMSRAVEVLRKVAQSHRIHGPWKSLSQMQKITTRAAREALIVDTPSSNNDEYNDSPKTTRTNKYDEEHPYDTFTVLVAWLVLLSCSMYVIIKDSFLAKLWPSSYHRRNHHRGGHHHGNNGEAFSDGLLSRMPDLDYAAAIFINWCKEQLQIAPISDTNNSNNTVTTTGSVGGNNDYGNANTPSRATVNPIGGINPNQHHHHHSSSNRGHHHGQSNVRRRRKR